MIYKVVDEITGCAVFNTASQHVWRPGYYADERAAKYSFRFPDKTLITLRDRAMPDPITFEMLQQAQRAGGIAP